MVRLFMLWIIAALVIVGCGSADKTDVDQPDEVAPSKTLTAETVKVEDKDPGKAKVGAPEPKLVRPTAEKLSASHILLAYKGAKRARDSITRTREEASKLAAELSAKAKGGEDFEKLAAEHSDCPSGKRAGGDLGIFPSNRMAPEFSEGVLALEIGQISESVESPFGFHVIKRQKVEEVHTRHILVMHDESKRKPPSIQRSKADAKKLIEEIAVKLKDGADFAELARQHSDCPSGKRAGGDLGSFGKGKMAPAFEKTSFALNVDQISEVIETDFGYHIIQRLP